MTFDPNELVVMVPANALREMILAGRRCADDLEAELTAQYPERDKYPSEQRRFDRDMIEAVNFRKYADMIGPKVKL